MHYVAGFILIILLGFSGGISSVSDSSKNSQEARASSFSEPQQREKSESGTLQNTDETKRSEDAQYEEIVKQKEIIDLRLPAITIISVQNIESNSAVLQAEVNMRSHQEGLVFLVYGYDKRSVENIVSKYNDYSKIPKLNDDRVRIKTIDSRPKGLEQYKHRLYSLIENTDYFFQVCVQHNVGISIISCGNVNTFTTNLRDARNDNFREPRVNIDRAINITAYEAEIEGDVSMNDGRDGISFFVYGESRELIYAVDKYDRYSAVDEEDDLLQKIRTSLRLLGRSTHNRVIKDLDKDTEYYYRFCVEYDGEEDGVNCSSVRSFTTDRRDRGDVPSVTTGQVFVSGSKAVLSGSVNMRDFNDGLVFFVYGTDDNRIAEVHENDSFNRISQTLYALQRVSVDNDHDGKGNFSKNIQYLKKDSNYYYRLCVEYEYEDNNNREKLFLSCGEVRNFRI